MIGNRIKFFQDKANINSKELAESAGISATYLSYVINDKRKNPSMDVLKKIAEVLNVNVTDFFEDEFKEVSILFERVTNDISKLCEIYKTDPSENLESIIKTMKVLLNAISRLIGKYNELNSKLNSNEESKKIMFSNTRTLEALKDGYEKLRKESLSFIDKLDELNEIDNLIDENMKAIIEALKDASPSKKTKVLKMIELFEDEK